MKILITNENRDDEFLMVDAIYKGYKVRITTHDYYIDGVSDESELWEKLTDELGSATDGYSHDVNFNYSDEVKLLVRFITNTPNSSIISYNEFEYADGVFPIGKLGP